MPVTAAVLETDWLPDIAARPGTKGGVGIQTPGATLSRDYTCLDSKKSLLEAPS